MNATALQPFLTVALPIMFTILIAVWVNNNGINKGFDGIHKRLDHVVARLDRIEAKLDNHETRIVRVEERTSPIGKR